jgi:hypothetical protein
MGSGCPNHNFTCGLLIGLKILSTPLFVAVQGTLKRKREWSVSPWELLGRYKEREKGGFGESPVGKGT